MQKPFILVLEGLDFSGKSSQATALKNKFMAEGTPIELLRDPGGTKFGEQIRAIVKNGEYPLCVNAQFLAFMAARAELAAYVTAQFEKGTSIILDRWWPSTFAYQGAQGIAGNDIVSLARRYTPLPRACYIYLDVGPEVTAIRKRLVTSDRSEGITKDRYETEDDTFRKTLRARYDALVFEQYLARVDANGDFETVQAAILAALEVPRNWY